MGTLVNSLGKSVSNVMAGLSNPPITIDEGTLGATLLGIMGVRGATVDLKEPASPEKSFRATLLGLVGVRGATVDL